MSERFYPKQDPIQASSMAQVLQNKASNDQLLNSRVGASHSTQNKLHLSTQKQLIHFNTVKQNTHKEPTDMDLKVEGVWVDRYGFNVATQTLLNKQSLKHRNAGRKYLFFY